MVIWSNFKFSTYIIMNGTMYISWIVVSVTTSAIYGPYDIIQQFVEQNILKSLSILPVSS